MITKPMLASALDDFSKIKWPVWASVKIDGIRNLIINGKAVSRNFKNQPNIHIREWLSSRLVSGLDGELVLKGNKPFNDVQSEVMSFEGEPDFEYLIFDYVKDSLSKPYLERIEDLKNWYATVSDEVKEKVRLVLPIELKNEQEFLSFEDKCLKNGYEGVMLRSPSSPYKLGRSTIKEFFLIKVKRFLDSEATIIGFEERFHNENEKEEDAFGNTKRASCKANLVPTNTLGALIVKDITSNLEFKIGTGLDDSLRKTIWNSRDLYLGKLVKYKSQPVGAKDLPRFPVFLGFRSIEDLD